MNLSETQNDPGDRVVAIEATAGVWLSLRDRGMSAEEAESFMRWLQEDPTHGEAFNRLDKTWRDLDRLSALISPGAAANPDTFAPRYRRKFSKPALTAFASAAMLIVLFVFMWRSGGDSHFAETSVGAFQRLDLPDGSTAQLNTNSAIDVDMGGTERRVKVVRGEVHFEVRKNALKPFVVSVQGIRVVAVGTAFLVRDRSTDVEVLVTEGRVQLKNLPEQVGNSEGTNGGDQISAGEKALIPTRKADTFGRGSLSWQIAKISDEDIRRRLAWQERRLEFDGTTLAEAASEFNRYNSVQLVLDDSQISSKSFSGSFRADGYEAFVALLEQDFGVKAIRESGRIVLSSK